MHKLVTAPHLIKLAAVPLLGRILFLHQESDIYVYNTVSSPPLSSSLACCTKHQSKGGLICTSTVHINSNGEYSHSKIYILSHFPFTNWRFYQGYAPAVVLFRWDMYNSCMSTTISLRPYDFGTISVEKHGGRRVTLKICPKSIQTQQ